jgi:branched-chain amino acid transport system ATP-binding protein
MGARLLEVQGLCKAFGGIRAVDGISLTLAAGEIRALIGPNGAGKTTLFHLLSGLLRPDAGAVRLRGKDITALPPHRIWRQGLSRTFQLPEIFPNLSVLENVQVALLSAAGQTWRLWRGTAPRWRQQGTQVLEDMGLASQRGHLAGTLPYGDLKRLELALALAHDPAVVLLDEPTAGLAPPEREAFMRLIQNIVAKRGVAVLFTEHDMDVVFGLAQSVLVLHQGRVIAAGTPPAVRADAEVQRLYLGGRR